MTTVRKGQAPPYIDRAEFRRRFERRFFDPAFDGERDAITRLEIIAWQAYDEGRKAPHTRKAGPGFADPDYDTSVEWLETRDKLKAAEARRRDPQSPTRVLLICGSARNDATCPGEMSKSWRLLRIAHDTLAAEGWKCQRST